MVPAAITEALAELNRETNEMADAHRVMAQKVSTQMTEAEVQEVKGTLLGFATKLDAVANNPTEADPVPAGTPMAQLLRGKSRKA